jgi:antibiotic biosynthesis monooxygenase (ABM) superfamily enzyme
MLPRDLAEDRIDEGRTIRSTTSKARRSPVIARIWRGWTTPENADAYQQVVSQEVLPGIAARNLDGYHGAYLLRRDLGGEVEFATIMLFDSLEHVRAFAGEDYETAYVPPRARAVLARFDERSAHYDMLLQPGSI